MSLHRNKEYFFILYEIPAAQQFRLKLRRRTTDRSAFIGGVIN